MKCSYNPKELLGKTSGAACCPECGEIVLAGFAHPNYEEIYYYSLIRFVPDLRRMEPRNIGVILLNKQKIDYKLKNFDEIKYLQKWIDFFEEEIKGEQNALQPSKNSKKFLKYLNNLCENEIRVTEPCLYSSEENFDCIFKHLFKELVL